DRVLPRPDGTMSGYAVAAYHQPDDVGGGRDRASRRAAVGRLCQPSTLSAERLWAVCANRDASRAKGEAGRASVEQRFSWDASAARLLDIVMTLEGRSPARTPPTSAPAPAKTERSPYWLG